MTEATYRKPQDSLEQVRVHILEMAGEVEGMIAMATRGLLERNEELVSQVIDRDRRVDLLEMQIDDECRSILARNQPTAIDMRFLVAAMKITAELERIADSAVNVSQGAQQLSYEPPLQLPLDLAPIAWQAQAMVHDSLDAFVQRDSELARRVCRADDEVDRLYRQLFGQVVERMRTDATATRRALHLLLIARNFERIADHATNVAEDVVYYIEGRDIRHQLRASG